MRSLEKMALLASLCTAGSLFPMLKYKHIFQIKYTEAILSNNNRKLLWFEITKMLLAVIKGKFIILSFLV